MSWDLTGNANTNPNTNFIGTTDQEPLVLRTNNTEALRVSLAGNVGVGTTDPRTKVEIVGDWNGQEGTLRLTGDKPTIKFAGGAIAGDASWILHLGSDGPGNLVFFKQGVKTWDNVMTLGSSGNVGIGEPNPSSKLEIAAQDGVLVHGYQPFVTLKDSNSNDARARIQTANGDIVFYTETGLGSGVPALVIKNRTNTLEIHAQAGLNIVGYQPFLTLTDANSGQSAEIQTYNGDLVFYTQSGIGQKAPALAIKNGSGDITINGNLTMGSGKDVILSDVAEDFDMAGTEVEPGTVMAIDQDGILRPSTQPYDKRVAGVVSGAGDYRPAIVLGKQAPTDNREYVAVGGKVYGQGEADSSPIEVGDLLTTSSTPGHAMKASDQFKAFGAVVGKAP